LTEEDGKEPDRIEDQQEEKVKLRSPLSRADGDAQLIQGDL
jgi:hypothetical protein